LTAWPGRFRAGRLAGAVLNAPKRLRSDDCLAVRLIPLPRLLDGIRRLLDGYGGLLLRRDNLPSRLPIFVVTAFV